MNKDFTFLLKTDEKIVIKFEDSLEHAHCCTEATVVFIDTNGSEFVITRDSGRFIVESFRGVLRGVLNNNLALDPSLCEDIGYLYNEWLQSKIENIVYEFKNGREWWVGEKYNVWFGTWPVWLYNEKNGDIILEITPYYLGGPTWKGDEPLTPEELENARNYDEWIKTYKPLVIRNLPKNIAEKWLDQAEAILYTIEKNIKK